MQYMEWAVWVPEGKGIQNTVDSKESYWVRYYSTEEISVYEEVLKSGSKINYFDHLIEFKLVNKIYLILVIHHLIIDGVSWSILFNNLLNEYQGRKISRPFPYSKYIQNMIEYAPKIPQEKILKYQEINNKVDETKIKGKPQFLSRRIKSNFDPNNFYHISENEFILLCLSRAYKKVYGLDLIGQIESIGRDEQIGFTHETIGWFTSIYPLMFEVSNFVLINKKMKALFFGY